MKRFFKLFALVLLEVVLFWTPANAATVSVGLSVRMTRQTVSAATNMDIRFRMENAITSTGDTITLTFENGFSLAAISVSDVDLLHGALYETSKTLAGSAAAGVWGVAISGQTITFTPPTDVGGSEIADDEPVAIRIGTNASGGSGQITNPSTAGLYEVAIAGGFEGIGASTVTIVGSSSGGFTVGFTVPAPDTSSGGGGAPSGGGAAGAGSGPAASGGAPPPPAGTDGGTGDGGTADGGTGDGGAGSSGGSADGSAPGSADGTAARAGTGGTGSSGSGGGTSGGGSGGRAGGGASGSGGARASTGSTGAGGGALASTPSSTVITTIPVIPTAPSGTPLIAAPAIPSSTVIAHAPAPSAPRTNPLRLTWEIQGIEMPATGGEGVRVYQNEEVRLRIEGGEAIEVAWVALEGSRYVASPSTKGYVASVRSDGVLGTRRGTLVIRRENADERTYPITLEVVPPIQVQEQEDRVLKPASDAEVTVFSRLGRRWVSIGVGRVNQAGSYARYAQAGAYRIEAKKKGWRTIRQEVMLSSPGALSGTLVLDKELVSPLAALQKDAPIAENISRVAEATADVVGQLVEQVRTPGAQAVAEVAGPAAVVATIGATAAAASSFNVLAYLRFLLTQPALLIRRRRREKWGLVYNAITKQPIDLAIIRLVDVATGAVKQTRITDAQGRFAFLAGVGNYRFQVVKPGYTFPSALLAKETLDLDLVDLYHGEPIQVEGSATLTPNIPVDPIEKTETPAAVRSKRRWRSVQHGLSIGSLGIAGIAFLLQPTVGMGIFALGQVAAFFVFRRLAIPPKPKNWGIVYDGKTRKPLARAIVRIFDKKYNKLLETQVTDRDGKYAFFAGKNVYYVTADVQGYERFISKEIDLRKETLGVVREPLALMPKA